MRSDQCSSSEVLVLLSGGLDSTACLRFYIDLGRPTCGMFIDYLQPAANREGRAAREVADYFGVPLYMAQWRGQIKKKQPGVVVARNAFLLTAALMERPESVTAIALGIHAGTQYADCSRDFIDQMRITFDIYSGGSVHVVTPFVDWSKSEVWEYALSSNVPIDLTYSCESGTTPSCGHCLSCIDRAGLESHA